MLLWRKKKIENYAVRLLTDLLRIYSPSGKEGELSDFLVKELASLGFTTKKDNVGNVLAEIGRGQPVILLCGHIDTVTGDLPVKVENNQIYGRGAVDAKGSMAAMIMAALAVAKENAQTKLVVVGVVDEEGKSRGIKHLISKGLPVDYAIFGEPSGIQNITIGYKGSICFKLTLETNTGHSSASWLYENAIEKAFELWKKIKNKHKMKNSESPYRSITSCLIRMKGGQISSTVPSRCEMHVDVRVPPQTNLDRIISEIENIIAKFQKSNPKVLVKMKILGSTVPFEVDKKSPLVQILSRSIRETKKKSAVLLRKTGTGDMNLLGEALKVPMVTYGPGNSHLDHTPNEHIDIDEYLDSIEVYKDAILKLAEQHKKSKKKG